MRSLRFPLLLLVACCLCCACSKSAPDPREQLPAKPPAPVENHWYILGDNDMITGPYTLTQMQELPLDADTRVALAGQNQWVTAAAFPQLLEEPPLPEPAPVAKLDIEPETGPETAQAAMAAAAETTPPQSEAEPEPDPLAGVDEPEPVELLPDGTISGPTAAMPAAQEQDPAAGEAVITTPPQPAESDAATAADSPLETPHAATPLAAPEPIAREHTYTLAEVSSIVSVGMTDTAVRNAIGAPNLKRAVGDKEIWQYNDLLCDDDMCQLFAIAFKEGIVIDIQGL